MFPRKPLQILGFLAVLLLTSATTHAAVYYLTSNTGNTDWTSNTSVWYSTNSGTLGAHPATIAGNDFDLNGFTIIATNGANTFPGKSLLFNGGGVRLRGSTTVNSGSAIGGSVIFSQDTSGLTFTGSNFTNVSGTTTLRVDNGAAATFNTTFSNLSGAGSFAIDTVNPAFAKTLVFSATNASTWTGNLTWLDSDVMTLQFGNGLISGGGLIAPSNARITLDQNVTFASLSLSGTSLGAGTYSYAYLNANFDSIFTNGAFAGSITVVPEPAISACLIGGLALLVFKRRQKKSESPARDC